MVKATGNRNVGAIPFIVEPLYLGFGYHAWIIACLLMDIEASHDRRAGVAAFVITQCDVVMDPASATMGWAWVWFDGGGYFAALLSNFPGSFTSGRNGSG